MLTKYTELRTKVDKVILLLDKIPRYANKYAPENEDDYVYTDYAYQRLFAKVELANQLKKILSE